MDAESKIRIAISSVLNGKGFNDATTATNKLKKATSSLSINAPFKALKDGANSLVSPFNNLRGAITAVSLGVLTKEALKLADTYSLVNSRLKLISSSNIELAINEQEVYKISQRSKQGYKDTADLYYSIARSTESLGKTQTETLGVTETINKSLVISGASAESSKAALIQLGQGFAIGTLRGEELNSVLEQAPRLAEAIAKGMSVTVGELRMLGEQGKLTGEAIFKALQNQADAVNKEFMQITPTVEQAMTNASNSTLKFIGTLDKLTGTSAAVATAISNISSKVDQYSDSIRVTSSSVFEQKTVDDITIKANQIADEIAGLKTALKEDDGWLWFGLDNRTTSEYENKIKRLEQQMGQLGDTAVRVLWKTEDATKTVVMSASEVKKQTDEALKAYLKYYETIGDYATAWSIKERELITSNTVLDETQLQKMLSASKKAYLDKETESSLADAKKLEEDYYDYIVELNKTATKDTVDQEVLSQAYKYQKFLDEHKLSNSEKIALEKDFVAAIDRIQMEGQQETLKKQEDALLEYYKAIGNEVKAGEIQLKRYKEELDKTNLTPSQKNEMYSVAQKDYNRAALQKQLEQNERYYEAIGDYALAAQMKIEKLRLELERDNFSTEQIDKIIAAEEKALAKSNAFSTVRIQGVTTASEAFEIYKERVVASTLSYGEQIVTIMEDVSSGMNNSFESFFDAQSDNFMDFRNLANNILNDIYMSIMRTMVISPLVNSITSGIAGFAGNAFSSASTSSASSSSYSGSLTNAYFQAYNGGLIPYASGGYTGDGGKYEPKGVVHGGEYVIPKWMVQQNKPLVTALEVTRRKGYAEGGSVGGNVSTALGTSNMKIEIINQSGTQMEVTNTKKTMDAEGEVIQLWISGITKNRYGARDMLGAK